ncbi:MULTISPECIES: tRNA1(Val) (adenine(37)-N6)-methyltransferase [Roseomonadaceae]|uniref:Methyltransferase domain-containing protein n=1 Tax=Falsiroseomonas oleicola TaxID=2801474 RepID=A0ABS6HA86_9PROT|nr:methyltransferase domain-containing protein [Roseomonas oleicola]MBU8545626.1 methyltransferase domain-containing protein [Roseomonas oleicola]
MGCAELTEDSLLGGRVRLRQPRAGLRAGHDAVLLAAAVPAKPGETVLEAGCGSGAGFLCLLARVPGLRVVAVERDPCLAALARDNAAQNGFAAQVTVLEGDVADPALRRELPRLAHGFANPPYWPEGTPPPDPLRAGATHAEAVTLSDWTGLLAAGLAHRGSLTLVLPAARFADGLAALAAAGCGSPALLPLWPRVGVAAKRVLLAGRRGGRGPGRVLPGLVLHGAGEAAEPVLRQGAALPL